MQTCVSCEAETTKEILLRKQLFCRSHLSRRAKDWRCARNIKPEWPKMFCLQLYINKPSLLNIGYGEYCAIGKRLDGWTIYDDQKTKIHQFHADVCIDDACCCQCIRFLLEILIDGSSCGQTRQKQYRS